uniref:ABC transporter domain-containing protein n=1 Tax=Bicosoecida sp. CB-2014 TaxID=1486930 RepID=A0A7S1CLU2_9STRA
MDEETQSLVLHSEITMRLVEGITVNCSTHDRTIHPNAKDIAVTNCTMSLFGFDLLQDTDIKLSWGQRYGLIGPNGCGKSTLMHMLGRRMIPMPKSIDSFHVTSEVEASDKSALTSVMEVDVERRALEAEADEVGELLDDPEFGDAYAERLNAIYERLEELEADTAEMRAAAILHGLGFDRDMQNKATKDFSGGWRMRIALARALFLQPSLLLLDEPTNHLDYPAVVWLTDYLNRWEKTVIVVSHDREFLNDVTTDVIHVDNKKLVYYRGNFDAFEESRAERRRHQLKAIESQEARRKHMQAFVDRFRYNAKRASLAQSRLKALARMESLDEVIDDPTWAFSFPDPGPLARPVLAVSDVSFGYTPEKTLFTGVEFGVDTDSRIAILGPNGAGKSTLLNLLLGNLNATSGHVTRNGRLRTAVFTQHHVAQLDLHRSPVEHMLHKFGPSAKRDAVRSHLGKFGISGDLALQKMGTLSGGQKSRVAFAQITWTKPHLVCLDEPTNHLDLDTIDALIVALGAFNGGVVIVSHDQHFVSSVADEIWYVADGKVTRFEGTLAEYKKSLLDAVAAAEARR